MKRTTFTSAIVPVPARNYSQDDSRTREQGPPSGSGTSRTRPRPHECPHAVQAGPGRVPDAGTQALRCSAKTARPAAGLRCVPSVPSVPLSLRPLCPSVPPSLRAAARAAATARRRANGARTRQDPSHERVQQPEGLFLALRDEDQIARYEVHSLRRESGRSAPRAPHKRPGRPRGGALGTKGRRRSLG